MTNFTFSLCDPAIISSISPLASPFSLSRSLPHIYTKTVCVPSSPIGFSASRCFLVMLIPSEPLNVSFDARLPVTLPSYLLSLPSLLSALPPSLVCLLSLAVLSEISSSSSRQPLESTAVASTDTASSVRKIFSLVFLISSPFLLTGIITIFSHLIIIVFLGNCNEKAQTVFNRLKTVILLPSHPE